MNKFIQNNIKSTIRKFLILFNNVLIKLAEIVKDFIKKESLWFVSSLLIPRTDTN